MPVRNDMAFAFMLKPMIHGIRATASIPDRTVMGGAPYAMLSQ